VNIDQTPPDTGSGPGCGPPGIVALVSGSKTTDWVRRGVLLLVLSGLVVVPIGCSRAGRPDGVVRVDQVGYATGETKTALLIAGRDDAGADAIVIDEQGTKVLTARVGRDRGAWNTAYGFVHPIDLTALTRPGTYRVKVKGRVTAESPPFRVGPAAGLFAPSAANAVRYFQAHRDGADQVSRPAAHLADRAATVYDPPDFDDDGDMTGGLTENGGPVDVEGGWYDAGDFLKFTHTTAYALILMLIVERDGPVPDGLDAEITHSLAWLDKMWDPGTRTLYIQVGIGSGDGGFLGDHDTWRLPQADDQLDVAAGDRQYYQRYRPVFRAADPGAKISPNLAGRVAAAFALAAQHEAAGDPARAAKHLAAAAEIFGLADTDPGALVTTEPRAFYPETTWHDDLAVAAIELARAGTLLHDDRAAEWAADGVRWTGANADDGGDDPLSVYDLGVLADAELGSDTAKDDLRQRLDAGVRAAAADPMGAAAGAGGSDYAARQLGWAATAALYRRVTGDDRYAAFGTVQRGVVLGANGWGTSLVIGSGDVYPRCPHDQIADLTREESGGVVNGPNAAERVRELSVAAPPSDCTAGTFAPFDRSDAGYTDSVSVSATTEPAIDFTATGLYAFTLTARAPG
jgi:endoglucanase